MHPETTQDTQVKRKGRKLVERLPLLWKRSINKQIKADPDSAIRIFLDNYKIGNDLSRMKYGLIQTLPESLTYVLSSLEKCDVGEEKIRILNLLSSSELAAYLQDIPQKMQKMVLNQIYINWGELRHNKANYHRLLSALNPNLISDVLTKMSHEGKEANSDLLDVWGPAIGPYIFSYYMKSPQGFLIDYLMNLTVEARMSILSKGLPARLSPKKTKLVLRLIHPSDLELNFVLGEFLTHLAPNSRKSLEEWLNDEQIPLERLVQINNQTDSMETLLFLSQLLLFEIKEQKRSVKPLLVDLISAGNYSLVNELLRNLNKQKDFNVIKSLLEVMTRLGKQAIKRMSYLQEMFLEYGRQDIPSVLKTYFRSDSKTFRPILLPSLQNQAVENSREFLEFLVSSNVSFDVSMLDLFSTCPNGLKHKLGDYIVKNDFIKKLHPLFGNLNFFMAILLAPGQVSRTHQPLMDKYLEEHLSSPSIRDILNVANKITYPELAFATIFDNNTILLKNVINILSESSEIGDYWVRVLVANVREALPLTINFLLSKSEYGGLAALLKALINEEPIVFWNEVGNLENSNLERLRKFYGYAFFKSIPYISSIMAVLDHKFFLRIWRDNSRMLAKEKGTSLLYELFRTIESQNVAIESVYGAIMELVRCDVQGLLGNALLRCSKLKDEFRGIITGLIRELITSYPEEALTLIDELRLNPLLSDVESFFQTKNVQEVTTFLYNMVPALHSEIYHPLIISYILDHARENPSFIDRLIRIFEENYPEISHSGEKLILVTLKRIRGPYETYKGVLKLLFTHPQTQKYLLSEYFMGLPIKTLEQFLMDPELISSRGHFLEHVLEQYKSRPPSDAPVYFMELYQRLDDELLRIELLPVLAEYFTWQQLPMLLKVPEAHKTKHQYQEALSRFAERFEISSAKALLEIWNAGLDEIYNQALDGKSTGLMASTCPNCGQPVLEGQKSCGFCPQQLTCLICRQSVIVLARIDVVRCPKCNSFFHRKHLKESVRIKEFCPICNGSLTLKTVSSLPRHEFSFM